MVRRRRRRRGSAAGVSVTPPRRLSRVSVSAVCHFANVSAFLLHEIFEWIM
ncbi:hypothetical protein E2C01_069616 [Portunus trituberculatus]|uniref:Uncharacterized protein n=1 Tax=Portunus trituberculatus TaxID=210409 RepID=A0A5B7HV09_PORTR|nr:hypothetical protein [Portunus trituberculatus]